LFLIFMFFITFFFLTGVFVLTAVGSAFRQIHKRESKKQLKLLGNLFFYRPLHIFFFPKQEFEGIYFATICAQNITRFFYAASAVIFLYNTHLLSAGSVSLNDSSTFWIALSFFAFVLAGFIFGDFLPRIFGTKLPEIALRLCAPFSSIFMYLVFPISFLFLKLTQSLSRTVYFDHFQEPTSQAKQEIIDIIQQAELSPGISGQDKLLFESVLEFRDRIAREVMVPRIDIFSLASDTTIKEAAQLLDKEGYSRTPVFKNTIDNIVGVLMYKDIMKKFMEYAENGNDTKILEAPIESIAKPAIYTPETKKISNLLQEFRKKQVHLAIVVDEYGGTEGIVTIEDILEEIVGEIADEYDKAEELFKALPDNSWIVDARMNILDAEEQFGITFPQEGDYDTIGGYVYHMTGAIPSKGFEIHQNDFNLEVLSSNERSVEKVRIRVLPKAEEV